ncbi:MAG: NAD-dependent epimerase/dehydratase family protein [Anaerolineaceae bacterium]|nr:NAD-dependent epimerase/dehydratase family protein [Anaerolineaceae bacterium]
MKILVTGGAGFIGSHVVDLLIESGHQVVVVDNLSTGRKSNLNPRAKFYQVDIRSQDLEKVFEAERPEVVDHHAAQMDVRRSVADPIYDADINVLGGLNLLNLAVKYGVRKFIHISSGGAVYGEPVYVPCDENHPVQPLCPYGATKYILELYLYMYKANYGLDYTILRYGNVYGPRQDPAGEAGVVAIFTGHMLKSIPVTIFGTGEQVRDYVFVKDCARANLIAVEKGSGQVFNLGCGVPTTVNQIFNGLKEITQYPLEANYGPARTGETFQIYLSAEKARQQLGWLAEVSLMDGLRKTVEYFKDRGQNA